MADFIPTGFSCAQETEITGLLANGLFPVVLDRATTVGTDMVERDAMTVTLLRRTDGGPLAYPSIASANAACRKLTDRSDRLRQTGLGGEHRYRVVDGGAAPAGWPAPRPAPVAQRRVDPALFVPPGFMCDDAAAISDQLLTGRFACVADARNQRYETLDEDDGIIRDKVDMTNLIVVEPYEDETPLTFETLAEAVDAMTNLAGSSDCRFRVVAPDGSTAWASATDGWPDMASPEETRSAYLAEEELTADTNDARRLVRTLLVGHPPEARTRVRDGVAIGA